MAALHAAKALMSDGWQSDIRLSISGSRITSVEVGVAAQPEDERHAVVVPGVPNLHSHAFQRGMAGLAERRGPSTDSFWSWRDVMYRFALTMTPDHVEAVAAQLYVEMLEVGFTRVGEFHYLHHDSDGHPYADPAEMATRIAAAAAETGLGLTLLPVFYAHSGFGGIEPTPGQRRFVHDLDGYARLIDASRRAIAPLEAAVLGIAPHSLRAATVEEIAAIIPLAQQGPLHIHIAEQVKEVDDCQAWCGQRPVEKLLDALPVDERWCLIHATHMTEAETADMARSGAIAGLCPVTEANLGDGTFPAARFLAAGGRLGVGSDSNVQIGVAAELRQLEYSQRLQHKSRNVLALPDQSNGRALFDHALEGGSRALGNSSAGLCLGASADLVSLRSDHPALAGRQDDEILDSWIFSGGNALVDCVWVGGKKQVANGRHRHRDKIAARFGDVMRGLLS